MVNEKENNEMKLDSLKMLKILFNRKKRYLIVFIVSLIMSVMMIVIGVVSEINQYSNAIYFDPTTFYSQKDTYYIDVVGISDEICEIDGKAYYNVLDIDGFCDIVILSDKEFEELKEQNDFYYDYNSESIPNVKRIYGNGSNIEKSAYEYIYDWYELSSDDEFYEYFGKFCFDTTCFSEYAICYIVASILFFICISNGVYCLDWNRNFKRSVNELNDNEILFVVNELKNRLEIKGNKHNLIFTDNYIYDLNKGIIIAYKDIIWIYETNVNSNYSPLRFGLLGVFSLIGKSIVINTKKITILIPESYYDLIVEKQPYCLKGHTKENTHIYKQIVAGVESFPLGNDNKE